MLLFFNPRESLYTPSSEETNLGLGIRKIFNDSFILGTHFFFDRKLAHSNKLYSQVGAGLEFLSQALDFRFNYYDPTTKAKAVDDTYEFGSTTLIDIKSMEEPLGGYDFEFGFPILPAKLNTRLYLGGFFFDSKLAKDNNGFRIRSETNLTNWFSLDMAFNSHNAQETEFIAGLRVTIPLELGRLLSKQNPFKTTPQDAYIQERERLMGETMDQVKRSIYLKDRLFERVVRDTDVQSKSVTKKEDVPGIEMIYVDNTKPAGGDGSLQHPYNTLAQAFASGRYAAGKYVYVFRGDGTNTGYKDAAGYTLADDVVLWGSGYNGGYKGLPVTPGYPMLGGKSGATIANPIITLANHNTVMGLDIEYGTYGIYGLNKNGASILHNNIANNSNDGVYLGFTDSANYSDFTFTDNTITGNTDYGIGVYNYVAGTTTISDFTFTDNTITGNGSRGIGVFNYAARTISDFTFTGNTITAHGISVGNYGTGKIKDFTFTDNTITGNSDIFVLNFGSGITSNFTFTGNTITGNSQNGIWVYSFAGAISGFTFTDNTITGNTENGILLDKGAGVMSGINLGNGALGGNNSIYDNNVALGAYFDLKNDSGIDLLLAQYNWWGQAEPDADQFGGANTVDHTHPLLTPP